MQKRNDPKPIQGWGWLGDAAEEAAVEAMAPARLRKNASATTGATKSKQKTAPGRARVPPKADRPVQRLTSTHLEGVGDG